jgi:aldose 1-epimerase
MTITLEAHGYRLTVSPTHGATILRADWQRGDGTWLPILEPLLRPQEAMNAGCFIMAPFANRIHHGRFSFAGDTLQFPMNRQLSDMACHGFARDIAWQVLSRTCDTVTLGCAPDSDLYPWRFSITETLKLSPDGLAIDLDIQNTGNQPLPFGFGLHPWFPRPDGTTLTFKAAGAYQQDAFGLPLADLDTHPAFVLPGIPLEQAQAIDLCFCGWAPRQARIHWPSRQMAVDLHAEGALKHLHVYLPEQRAVFCAEPVSHAPDVINRPQLGADAAMTVLAPGEGLNGRMTMRALAA